MAQIELTTEELATLKEVLENDVKMLRQEIVRTEHREFRKVVKHKEQILEKILAALSG